MSISVVCFANCGAVKHAHFMVESLTKLATNPANLHFILVSSSWPVDLGPFNDILRVSADPPCQHGEALNFGLANAYRRGADLLIGADADIAVTTKEWDKRTVECLSEEGVGIVGAGNPSGYKGQRHLNFPVTQFFAMRAKVYDQVKPDFREKLLVDNPTEEDCWKVLSEEEAKLFGLPSGMRMHLDAGWHLPFDFRSCGYEGRLFDYVKTGSPEAKLGLERLMHMKQGSRPIRDKCISEYQLDGEPIVTHLRQTRKRDYDDPMAKRWRALIIRYVAETYGIGMTG